MQNSKSQAETKVDSEQMMGLNPSSQNGTKPNVGCCYLTVKQVSDACKKNDYLLFRFNSGYQMGVNGKVAILARKRTNKKDNDKTDFVSFIPCGINEYIEHKHPYY